MFHFFPPPHVYAEKPEVKINFTTPMGLHCEFTTRKTIIDRNVLCGASKSVCSIKIFLWHIEKYASQKF
jgi:hypothetical protein